MASASEELSSQAEQLQQAIGYFKIDQKAHLRPAMKASFDRSEAVNVLPAQGHAKTKRADSRFGRTDNGCHKELQGVVLQMGGNETAGKDLLDSDFERY
jgi:hypothetical protein